MKEDARRRHAAGEAMAVVVVVVEVEIVVAGTMAEMKTLTVMNMKMSSRTLKRRKSLKRRKRKRRNIKSASVMITNICTIMVVATLTVTRVPHPVRLTAANPPLTRRLLGSRSLKSRMVCRFGTKLLASVKTSL